MFTTQHQLENAVREKAADMGRYIPTEDEYEVEAEDILYTYEVRDENLERSLELTGITRVVMAGDPQVEIQVPSGRVFGTCNGIEPVVIQGDEEMAAELFDHYGFLAPVPTSLL